jgi:hypothetical protein
MRARFVAAALLTCLLAAPLALADDSAETLTDRRTGLVWVADPQFPVSNGFANGVVLSRPRALRMVARMNAGTLPNFGRTDWRLPTHRELHRFLKRHGGGVLPNPRGAKVRVWPVAGAATLPGVPAVAVLGTNSVRLFRDSEVTGDVVANDASPGPTLGGTVELKIDRGALVTGDVKADSIQLDQQAEVTGNAQFNSLSNSGAIGSTSSPLGLPVFPLLPVFQTSAPRSGADDVFVGAGETTTLAAADYDSIQVAAGGTLVLSGGVYQVNSLTLDGDVAGGCAFPCSSLAAAAGADVRIAQRLSVGIASFVGPQSESGITAADIVVYVGGIDGTTGVLGDTPLAAKVSRNSRIEANVYAPNGTLNIERDSAGVGAFFGRDVAIDQRTTVTLASYFVNHPPVAFPVTAFTNGAAPITITLRGADPDDDSLTFSIVGSGPTNGSLGPVTPVTPPEPPPDPERPPTDPQPVTEATVVYTPDGAGNLEDSFSFQVSDGFGGTGTAVVTINPPGSETPPPPDPATVVADDSSVTTTTDRPVTVTLTAGAPTGVQLTFAIVEESGPASGSLGPLVQGSESPRRSASVVYTPATGFNGDVSFQFTACGLIDEVNTCDTGDAAIQVSPPAVEPEEIAPDQSVSTPTDTPVTFTLGSPSGTTGGLAASGSGLRAIAGKAISFDPAEVAGNVADADENGFGDNHNNLPGPVPGLISAGVDQTGGAGSNGTVRIHAEWDISFMTAPITGETSAQIMLTTNRGTVDSRDTFFFAGGGGNGTLEDGDFQAANGFEPLGVVMPVTGLVGADGTFSFDIRATLNDAIAAGADFFTVQGRVDESLAGPARGLQIYSSASGNTSTLPALILSSPPPLPPTTYEILSLPAGGLLFDGATQITAVPYTLSGNTLSYTPNVGFLGTNTFSYQATFGEIIDTGLVTIVVQFVDCGTNVADCDDGRD